MTLSFQSRIILLFAALFIVVQAITLLCAYRIARDNVTQQLDQHLSQAVQVFEQLLMNRSERIASEARLLVADYGFRSTISEADSATIGSALQNLSLRIHGQRAFYIQMNGMIVADTEGQVQNQAFMYPQALNGTAPGETRVFLWRLDNELYEWAIVPVLSPLQTGWLAIALRMDRARIAHFQGLAMQSMQISIFEQTPQASQILVSSLTDTQQQQLQHWLNQHPQITADSAYPLQLDEQHWLSRSRYLASATTDPAIIALLQIDFATALTPYRWLLTATFVLSLLGLLVALLGSWLIARRLAQPMQALVDASAHVMEGQFASASVGQRHDELGQLAKTFERAAQLAGDLTQLKHQDQQRRQMVATVSHDLRTPLTALHGFLETLRNKADRLAPLEQQQFLDIAMRQSLKVSHLAEELFELAKLECDAQSLHWEAFWLPDLIQDVLQKCQLTVQHKQIEFNCQIDVHLPMAWGDLALIERVFTNLIDNALRHTPNSGQISLAIHYASQRIQVAISDTGEGIAAEYLPSLFERDSLLLQQHKQVGGGLGLLVVSKILSLHGSKIQATSQLGQGSQFYFDLASHAQTDAQ